VGSDVVGKKPGDRSRHRGGIGRKSGGNTIPSEDRAGQTGPTLCPPSEAPSRSSTAVSEPMLQSTPDERGGAAAERTRVLGERTPDAAGSALRELVDRREVALNWQEELTLGHD
jgi:hypothetical protein